MKEGSGVQMRFVGWRFWEGWGNGDGALEMVQGMRWDEKCEFRSGMEHWKDHRGIEVEQGDMGWNGEIEGTDTEGWRIWNGTGH